MPLARCPVFSGKAKFMPKRHAAFSKTSKMVDEICATSYPAFIYPVENSATINTEIATNVQSSLSPSEGKGPTPAAIEFVH